MERQNVYLALLLFAATALTIWALVLLLLPFIVPIAWAMCLATVTGGLYRRLASRTGRPRLSAALMTFGVAIALVLPLAFVGSAVASQAVALSRSSLASGGKPTGPRPAAPTASSPKPGGAEPAHAEDAWARFFAEHPALDELQTKANDQLSPFNTTTREVAEAALASIGRPFTSGAVGVLAGLVSTVFGFLIMLATLYVLLRDGDAIRQLVIDVVPLKEEDTKEVLEKLRSTAFAAIVGGLATALVQGTLGGAALAITGVSAPVLWGFVMAILSLLPVGGSAFVWAPVAAYFLATGEPGKGWFLVFFGVVVLTASDNLLRPFLMRRAGATGIHPLLLFFGVFSGIGLFGASGIVFGPLLVAFILSVVGVYRDHFGRRAAARAALSGPPPAE